MSVTHDAFDHCWIGHFYLELTFYGYMQRIVACPGQYVRPLGLCKLVQRFRFFLMSLLWSCCNFSSSSASRLFVMDLGFENEELTDDLDELIDDIKPDKIEIDPDVDKFLRMEAKGERLPHVSTWDKTVLPPEDAETYLE